MLNGGQGRGGCCEHAESRFHLLSSDTVNPCLGEGPWALKSLSASAQIYPRTRSGRSIDRAIFYDGLPWKGNRRVCFAWYGAPARKGAERLPAMVLVHGGGGTAFANWVKLVERSGLRSDRYGYLRQLTVTWLR